MGRRPQAEGGWDGADQWLTKKLRKQIKCHQKMNSMPQVPTAHEAHGACYYERPKTSVTG